MERVIEYGCGLDAKRLSSASTVPPLKAKGPSESMSTQAKRPLYYALIGTLEEGLVRTAEDTLSVLRHASAPLGPMGAEWLKRQERNL